MTEPRALVKNAADPEQVKNAQRKEKDAAQMAVADMQAVLDLPAGRRMLWRVLQYCAPYESPSDPSNDHTRENIGRGDVGRYLIGEIGTARPEAFPEMMLAAHKENERANRNARSTGSRKPAEPDPHTSERFTDVGEGSEVGD